jgi:predicted Zn-dependent protease
MSKGPPQAKSRRSAELLERGSWAMGMNRFGEAEQLASEVLKAERGNAAAASLLGQALLAQNRAGEAIAPLERAAKRNEDPALETLYAIALGTSGRRDEAISQLRRTIAKRPTFPPAFRELASQLGKSGDSTEAIAVLERCLADTPHLVELQMDLALLHLGRNNRRRAREALTTGLASAPGRPELVALMARIMLLDGEFGSAASAYRHVLAQRPDDAVARTDFAVSLMEMGDAAGGEANLRAATRHDPHIMLRAVHCLTTPSRGRFFLRPSAVRKFLQDDEG